MSDVPLSAFITRTSLPGSQADLQLNDHTNFVVVSWGPGPRRWVRDVATAPAVHGATQVSARMDLTNAPVKIRVLGATTAALKANAAAMALAFAQLNFHLKITWDTGWYEEWKCMAADGGHDTSDNSFDPLLAFNHQQVYAWSVPRQPINVAGVI